MKNPQLIEELNALIEKGLSKTHFPYKKGNSIRIGKMIVRTTKHGNLVYDSKTNRQVAHTFSKLEALGIAKTLAHDENRTKRIVELDTVLQKHFLDAMFYKHSMNKTKEDVRRDILQTRYEISADRIEDLREQLSNFLFY